MHDNEIEQLAAQSRNTPMFSITLQGPRAGGKSTFIHRHLIPALRDAGWGAKFYDDHVKDVPDMELTGRPFVLVIEKH
jgi:hypothetical protein